MLVSFNFFFHCRRNSRNHFLPDPALSTLAGDFIERPTLCLTTRREDLTGLLNCTWSSCREGCTSDYFKCSHIFVSYIDVDKNQNFTYPYNATYEELANFTTDIEKSTIESVLQVNIKGCGCKCFILNRALQYIYNKMLCQLPDPPSVKCKNFTDTFGYEGNFHDFYSTTLSKLSSSFFCISLMCIQVQFILAFTQERIKLSLWQPSIAIRKWI